MQVQNVCVGDWVICYEDDEPFYKKVDISDFCLGNLVNCDPVPLEKDILADNGFYVTKDSWGMEVWKLEDNPLVVIDRHFYIHLFGSMHRIDYVHELQYLMRAMGVKREIQIKSTIKNTKYGLQRTYVR